MKPEQFIKRYGVDQVKNALASAPEGSDFIAPYDSETILVDYYKAFNGSGLSLWNENEWVCLSRMHKEFPASLIVIPNLKRIVESLDLVNCFDDLEQAKSWVSDIGEDFPYMFKGDTYDNRFYKHELVTAIADHESIYGGGDDL